MRYLTIIFLLLYSANVGFSQESKFKALFIYNFAKYLNWPEGSNLNDLKVSIIGSDEIYNEMLTISKTKKVGNLPIKVSKESNPDKIAPCQIIFISSSKSGIINQVFDKFKDVPTIIISDCDNCSDSSFDFNFITRDKRLGYELNKSNVSKKNIKISNELIALSFNNK